MATEMAAQGHQQKGLRRLALVVLAVAMLGLTGGCIEGNTGPEGLSEAPNVGFDPVSQGPTTLAVTVGKTGG